MVARGSHICEFDNKMKPEVEFQPIVQRAAPTAYYSSNDIVSRLYTKLDSRATSFEVFALPKLSLLYVKLLSVE